MGRAPCCDKANVKKGPWSPEEDLKLKDYIEKNGTGGNWLAFPQKAGLKRCGKSCRLRWLNYLRPNLKHGEFSDEEDRVICTLFATIGSRWSIIAAQLPGRTDNDIKNYWNTKLKKKLISMAPPPHKIKLPSTCALLPLISSHHQTSSFLAPLYKDCTSFINYTCTPSTISSSDLWKYPMTNSSNSPSLFQFQDGGSMMSNMSSPTGFEESNNNGSGQNVIQQYWTGKETNGFYEENATDVTPILDRDVEDIKEQLISSSCNINNSFNIIEENKTELVEKTMYCNHYY